MAFEIPLDQIKQLKTLLRKEANLSWYEPEKEGHFSLPKLPSVAETIAELDPSPPYLRCKNCNGRLLRGLQSSICIFCGTNPHKDLPPDPIKFKDTLGYRWLLDSLQLDGSVMVGPILKADESKRGSSASNVEVPLSELLDLEIRWPSESERLASSNSDDMAFQSKSSLNLSAADLDSFFTQRESGSNASEGFLTSNKKVDDGTDNTFLASENLSLFQNVQVPETATRSTEDQSGDSFSSWEANFQSASSGAVHQEPQSTNYSAVDLDAMFGTRKNSIGVRKNEDLNPSPSMEDDWFQGDARKTSNSEVTGHTRKSEMSTDHNDIKAAETNKTNSSSLRNFDVVMKNDQWEGRNNKTTDSVTADEFAESFNAWDDFTGSATTQVSSNSVYNPEIISQTRKSEITADPNDTKMAEGAPSCSTQNLDWMQDDQWQGSNDKTLDSIANSNNDLAESFDAWNDFTSSATTQDSSNNVWKQTLNQTSFVEKTSETILFSSPNNSHDMDFPNLFSGHFSSSPLSSAGANITQSGASSDRVADVDATGGKSRDEPTANSGTKDDVEILLSQMHDLSFMLESNLALPPK